jgi:hypothetical protein
MNTNNENSQPRQGAWIFGAVLILVGFVFLMQNFLNISLHNWWALFILIPAFGAYNNAWHSYQEAGKQVTASTRSSLIGGTLLTLLTAIFLFDLNWALLGPVLLILLGLSILLNVHNKQ